jgi:hypothetical protein
MIAFPYAIFHAVAAHSRCPFCGESFAGRVDVADEDVSGSGNHCASCKVGLR